MDTNNFTPRQIVAELDKYVIGQSEAKKMVAIALRNRWRAKQLPEDVREEYTPKIFYSSALPVSVKRNWLVVWRNW